MKRLLSTALVFALFSPAQALVEPEIEAWSDVVSAAREVCQGPGVGALPEALDELGGLASDLMSAPLDDLMVELEERRGLKFKYFTPWHVKDRKELKGYLAEQLDKEMPPEKAVQATAVLRALQLVPEGFEVRAFLEKLLTSQVAGVYDPVVDQFFLVDTASEVSLRDRVVEKMLKRAGLSTAGQISVVTIHELDHALGGQHFRLKEIFAEASHDWSTDRTMAAQALVEGDATFVMIDHQNKTSSLLAGESTYVQGADTMAKMVGMMAAFPIPLPGMGDFGDAPLYFQKGLMFPYFNGAELVSTLRHQTDNWAAVNTAYGVLPTTTEQILHPETYLYAAREPRTPDLSSVPKTVGPWKWVVDDTGGEFLLRIVLEQHGVEGFAEAAEGWDGDRIRVYRNGSTDELAFVWVLHWDTKLDAQEFHQAIITDFPFQAETRETQTVLWSGFDQPSFQLVKSKIL